MFKPFLAFATVLLLSACMATNPYAPVPKELGIKVRVFEDVVRWGDLRKMYMFGKTGTQVTLPQGFDNVRVNRYEAGDMRQTGPWQWSQTAIVEYVLTDTQVVRQLADQQVWASDDEGASWYRLNPPPAFR